MNAEEYDNLDRYVRELSDLEFPSKPWIITGTITLDVRISPEGHIVSVPPKVPQISSRDAGPVLPHEEV
jgi:hypothetical protein